jgi:hypothetical protein
VTTTDLEQATFVGIRAVYEDMQYDVGVLARYFSSLGPAWKACFELAALSARQHLPSALETENDIQRSIAALPALSNDELERLAARIQSDEARLMILMERGRRAAEGFAETSMPVGWPLVVSHLRIESPMEITVAVVQSGGTLGVSAYAIHLLRQVLHDPDRVGRWLGRLIEGWHRGMQDAETAGDERKQARERRAQQQDPVTDVSLRLKKAGRGLSPPRAVEIETIGAGDPPDDLVAATDNLPDEGPTGANSPRPC